MENIAAVTSTVQAVVGSSVSAAVGSSAAASSASAIQLIGYVQLMSVNSKMQEVVNAPAFGQITSGMSWATLSFEIPSVRVKTPRRMLKEDGDAVRSSIYRLFWIGITMVPLVSVRVALRNRLPKYGILAFPQLELMVAQMLMLPFVETAASLFRLGHKGPGYVFGGIGALLILPVPLITYSVFFLYRAIVKNKQLVYRGKEWWVVDPSASPWLRAHESLYNGRVGYWYDVKAIYTVDPQTYQYKRYEVSSVVQSTSTLTPYAVPLIILKKSLLALFMGAIRSKARLIPIVAVCTYNVFIALSIPTFHSQLHRILHTGTAFSELGLYMQGLVLAYVPDLPYLELGMLAAQLLVIGLPILGQFIGTMITVVNLVRSQKRKRAMKQFMDCYKDLYRRHIVIKKYANKWKWIALGKPLDGWPRPPNVSTRKTSPSLIRVE